MIRDIRSRDINKNISSNISPRYALHYGDKNVLKIYQPSSYGSRYTFLEGKIKTYH